MITATNEDNMIMMARYPDDYFDLAIIDPPYGIGESSKNRNGIVKIKDKRNGRVSHVKINNEIKDWDKKPPNKEYFKELKRVSKNQIIFGANHFIEKIPNANTSSWIIWDKCNGTSDFADCEMAYTSFKNAVRLFRYMWSGMFKGKESFTKGHIFEGNIKLHEKRIHKTQKPVILYKWILHHYAKEGDKILDTHRGSASLDIACHNLGYDLVTCEIDTDYFNDGNKRLKQHQNQQVMKF